MGTRTFLFFVSVGCLSTLPVLAADWAQWRGPQRTGVSAEQGLAHQWPKDGPPLVWHVKDVGNGYGSPSVVGQRVYLLGSEGLENEFVEALDGANGQQLWRRRIGNVGEPEQEPNFPAARSTPTIDGDRLYAFGSDGDIVCLETASGRVIWQKNVKKDFKGKSGGWAYSESPLVDGNVVVCTPGGFEAAMIALNKMTGDVVWKCPIDDAEEAGYASAVITNFGGKKQYVQFYSKGVIGVDAASGKYLWRALETEGDNLATPIVKDGFVYSPISGTGGGLGQMIASGDRIEVKEIYKKRGLPNSIGGAVLVGDYLYGTTRSGLLCADFKTGEIKWTAPAPGAGAVCSADGMLFEHGENSEISLVEALPAEYREKGRFKLPELPQRKDQMEKPWSYPVVANGRLYLRDKNFLWCYNVADAAAR